MECREFEAFQMKSLVACCAGGRKGVAFRVAPQSACSANVGRPLRKCQPANPTLSESEDDFSVPCLGFKDLGEAANCLVWLLCKAMLRL